MLTKSDLSQIERIMEPIKQDVSSLKKNVRYIKKTVDVMIDIFDTQNIKLIKRVDKIMFDNYPPSLYDKSVS